MRHLGVSFISPQFLSLQVLDQRSLFTKGYVREAIGTVKLRGLAQMVGFIECEFRDPFLIEDELAQSSHKSLSFSRNRMVQVQRRSL